MSFDLLITGGRLLDGTGAAAYPADVGIVEGRIAEIGKLAGSRATRTLDASGSHVAPGFIDIHTHDDFNIPLNPLVSGKTRQGVTTVVTGNCGFSPAPVVPARRKLLEEVCSFLDSGLDYGWKTYADYLAGFPATGVNIVPLVGHVTVRCGAMGVVERAPEDGEMLAMKELVAEAMKAGAFGLSTGLIYPPSCYGETAEITELAGVAAQYGGGYFTHMRDEGAGVLDSIREAIAIGRGSGAYVQISHLKVTNPSQWGRAGELLALIDEARAAGLALTCDQYPYTAASTGMKTLLPRWVHEGGSEALVARLRDPETRARIRAEVLELIGSGDSRVSRWEDAVVSDSPTRPEAAGKNLGELAEKEGRAPVDLLLDLLLDDRAKTLGIYFSMGEEDVFEIMRHPAVAIGSDGIFFGKAGQPDTTKPHPRYFGTFPRVVGRYTREQPILALPEAVRKMTSLPADILGLGDRGRLQPGSAADVVVFDAETVIDRATYAEPHQPPVGIHTVLVNGVPVVEGGEATEQAPGAILRRAR